MPDVPAISVDMKGTKVLGASLEEIAKAQPKLFAEALGMQAKNIQKSIAAVARNYAIKHKVDGKTKPLVTFPERSAITIALHGGGKRKGVSKLTNERLISIVYGPQSVAVGFRGTLERYCMRWQTGGATGFDTDPRARRGAYWALYGPQLQGMRDDAGFRHELYRRLGPLGVHDRASLDAAMGSGMRGRVQTAAQDIAIEQAGQHGVALPSLPSTWEGRDYMETLGADINDRFPAALTSIIEKKIEGTIKRRGAT